MPTGQHTACETCIRPNGSRCR